MMIKWPKVLFLAFVMFSAKTFGQAQCERLTFILFIDNEIPLSGTIYESGLEIKDASAKILQEFPVKYEVGGLKFLSVADYSGFMALKPGTKVTVKLKYRQLSPEFAEYTYEQDLEAYLLQASYVIFKVYNFGNKKNKRIFSQKTGYGIEFRSSVYSSILPRKR